MNKSNQNRSTSDTSDLFEKTRPELTKFISDQNVKQKSQKILPDNNLLLQPNQSIYQCKSESQMPSNNDTDQKTFGISLLDYIKINPASNQTTTAQTSIDNSAKSFLDFISTVNHQSVSTLNNQSIQNFDDEFQGQQSLIDFVQNTQQERESNQTEKSIYRHTNRTSNARSQKSDLDLRENFFIKKKQKSHKHLKNQTKDKKRKSKRHSQKKKTVKQQKPKEQKERLTQKKKEFIDKFFEYNELDDQIEDEFAQMKFGGLEQIKEQVSLENEPSFNISGEVDLNCLQNTSINEDLKVSSHKTPSLKGLQEKFRKKKQKSNNINLYQVISEQQQTNGSIYEQLQANRD